MINTVWVSECEAKWFNVDHLENEELSQSCLVFSTARRHEVQQSEHFILEK